MAAQAVRYVTDAELLALQQQARQTRLAASRTIIRAVGIHAQATRRHAELLARRPPGTRRPGHGQPAGGSLAQLLQPLFAAGQPRPPGPGTGGPVELAAVRSIRSHQLGGELDASLLAVRREVRAIHGRFQLARRAGAGPGAGVLHLVSSAGG